VPGHAFGEAGRGFARCSYDASLERLDEAMARVGDFVRTVGAA